MALRRDVRIPGLLALALAATDIACSSKNDRAQVSETGGVGAAAGAGPAAGAAGSLGGNLSSGGVIGAGGTANTNGGTGGSLLAAGGNGFAGSSGGATISNGGASGAAAGGALGVGGASNGGGGGSSAGGSAVMYQPIDASQLGMPTRVAATTALTLAEGPLWDPCAHRLLFTDVSASKIYSLATDGSVSVFASNTGNANGIAFDIDGSLILAQMGGAPGHISRRDKMGTITPLEPPGTRLHTPDDVVVRSDGAIYFTDGDFPPIGTIDLSALPVYVLKRGATMLSNGGSVPGPNGVELSPDEKTLYVDSYNQGAVIQYAVAPDGSITKGATLASGLTNADSLCVDAAGNLYVGVSTGLQVLRPDGSKVALIRIQSTQGVTNCEFGGDDGKTLYITAWTTVWQITGMPIPGLQWSVNRVRLGCM